MTIDVWYLDFTFFSPALVTIIETLFARSCTITRYAYSRRELSFMKLSWEGAGPDLPLCAVSTYYYLFVNHDLIRLRYVDDYSGSSKHASVVLKVHFSQVAFSISSVSAKIRAFSTPSDAVYTSCVTNLTCRVCGSLTYRMLFKLWAMILTRGIHYQLRTQYS